MVPVGVHEGEETARLVATMQHMEAGERWKRVQRESQCLKNFIIQHGTVGLLVERKGVS